MNALRYIPTLRWKQAEREALLHLSAKTKAIITPLVDLLMPQPSPFTKQKRYKTPTELLKESKEIFSKNLPGLADALERYWGRSPIFVDASFIDAGLRAESLEQILSKTQASNVVPVLTLGTDRETIGAALAAVRKTGQGVCLRLFRGNLDSKDWPTILENFLVELGLSSVDIDLIIDFKTWDERCGNIEQILKKIPRIDEWRTLTFLSGSFPPDLSEFDLGLNYIPRHEWNSWKQQIQAAGLARNPSFGDYTILHPIYKEPVTGANPSASIRYSLCDKWLIMRGQGLRSGKSAGHAQFPAQAKLLAEHSDFFGAAFSYGDLYIAEKGANIGTDKPGSTTTWLRAGINHHLECTADQIASLGENISAL